jgi:hypothetical protein
MVDTDSKVKTIYVSFTSEQYIHIQQDYKRKILPRLEELNGIYRLGKNNLKRFLLGIFHTYKVKINLDYVFNIKI